MTARFKRIHDITTLLGVESIDYPGDPPFRREMLSRINDGAPCDLAQLRLSAHAGTHLDAPAHFMAGEKTIDQFFPHEFILPAHVVSVNDKVAVRPSDLEGADLRRGNAVLFKTDNSMSGRSRSGEFSEDFVCISLAAADYCIERGIALVGIDYISVDRHGDADYPVHRTLAHKGILILEGVDLSLVPAGKYTLICLPLRIAGGEASPVRAVLIEE